MVSTNDIAANILDFDEDEFFSAEPPVLEPREEQLLDQDYFGVAVNVPREIETGSRDKLPLIMAAKFSGTRDWDMPLRDNCVLVGTNLQDGTVRFAKAFVSKKELQSRGRPEREPNRGPKPPGLALAAAQLSALDARERLHIEWETGLWSLGVIYYDWPSNTVVVELLGDENITSFPAVPVSPEPDPRGAAFLPCFLPTAKTPQPPESGLAFTGEFKVENEKQHLNIFGSFVVKVQDFHLPAQKSAYQFHDEKQPNIAAVVPVTLAVLGLDWDEPLQFDWAVPVYGGPLTVGMPANGCFAIDAFATGHNAPVLRPGKYVCYLIMDGRIFGPKTLQV
ncbi:MAG TPA: hypothetical protein ENK33_08880 [Desulfobacterales bacterium]|nr:hypothetical protein [Desulfobacterales bacterium]